MIPRIAYLAFPITAVFVTAAAGCANEKIPPSTEPPPDWSVLRDAQQSRLEGLVMLRSGGVIELRWTDEDGEHYQQGDITLFLQLPSHLALSINKQVTDPFMWLGSDDEQFWYFDLLDRDNKVAYIGRHEDFAANREIPGAVHPMRLMDLAGLTPLPPSAAPRLDSETGMWTVETQGRGGPIRIFFDRDHSWPVQVDSLSGTGEVLFQSRLSRYQSVESPDRPRGAWPKLPHRIAITDVEGGGEAVVTLDLTSTDVDPSRLKNATDLDRLLRGLRPDRIEHVAAASE